LAEFSRICVMKISSMYNMLIRILHNNAEYPCPKNTKKLINLKILDIINKTCSAGKKSLLDVQYAYF